MQNKILSNPLNKPVSLSFLNKRIFIRYILLSIPVVIIFKWIIDSMGLKNARYPTELSEIESPASNFTFPLTSSKPRFSQETQHTKCKYDLFKTSVPCDIPTVNVTLCFPHRSETPSYNFNNTFSNSNITLVTGYFNLGSFRKGNSQQFTSDLYQDWMQRLGKIRNYMLIFVEDSRPCSAFKAVRSSLPSSLTQIIRIQRSDLWAFKLENAIIQIYKIPCYPKFHPNTVLATYSCVMHAKYDLMRIAVKRNYFRTKFFGWMDVGYFRDEAKNSKLFSLGLPSNFDERRIAYTEVYQRQPQLTCKQIVFRNIVWVGGGFFIGRGDVMLKWVGQYQSYVYNMLRSGLMSTDQQVIYCMFNDEQGLYSDKIQIYKAQHQYHDWFTLGYLCKTNGNMN